MPYSKTSSVVLQLNSSRICVHCEHWLHADCPSNNIPIHLRRVCDAWLPDEKVSDMSQELVMRKLNGVDIDEDVIDPRSMRPPPPVGTKSALSSKLPRSK